MSACRLCAGGKVQERDEVGWTSYVSLEHGTEHPGDEPHWFLRLLFVDKVEGTLAAENFAVRYCPRCGREL